jgi:ABC-2 type transport system permease protein
MRQWLRSYHLLLLWTLRRMNTDLPVFIIIQIVITIGVVTGFAFLIPEITPQAALYLSTGATTIALITVAMVLAPQVVSTQKQQGVLDYQRSLPVPRMAVLAADATMWLLIALPGLMLALLVAALRFDLRYDVSPMVLPAFLLVITGTIGIGYTIAYTVKPALVGIITNLIIIISLMFAPINYPAERLPGWLAEAHEWLPFQYMAQAVRETLSRPPDGVSMLPFVVLGVWSVVGLSIAARVMTHRK